MHSRPLEALIDGGGGPPRECGWIVGRRSAARQTQGFYIDFLTEGTTALSLFLPNVPEDQFHKVQLEGQNRFSKPRAMEWIIINYENSNYKPSAAHMVMCGTDKARGSIEACWKQHYFCYTFLVKYFLPLISNLGIIKTAPGIYFKNLTLTFQQKDDLTILQVLQSSDKIQGLSSSPSKSTF